MSNSLKGALLSGLVFPGLGQVMLKRQKRGIVLMLLVSVSLAVIANLAIRKALTILDEMKSTGGFVDMNAITNAASQASSSGDSIITLFLFIILCCWGFGIIDAYKIGKEEIKEKSEF